MRSRILNLSSWMFLLHFASDYANAQSAQEIAKKAFGSTVLLVMEDTKGQPLSLGSGFFVRDGEIATNLHVVEGAAKGYARLIGEKKKYDIEGITSVDPERDLVLLRISLDHSQVLTLGNSDRVEVGEPVYAVGNPQGLEGTFSQGVVSSIREAGNDKLLQITAPISPGSSGGPVLSAQGEVIGVSVATFRSGQNLNFAIPSNYLSKLIAKSGSIKPLSPARRAKAESILSNLGGRNSESVVGSQFEWSQFQVVGRYTFSVRNNLREDIANVVCMVIFYGRDGLPIETETTIVPGPIVGNLAKRTGELGRSDAGQVRNFTTKIEIRVLDFQFAAEQGRLGQDSSPSPPVGNSPNGAVQRQRPPIPNTGANQRSNPPQRNTGEGRSNAIPDLRVVDIEEHNVLEVLGDGKFIKLDNGTTWEVDEGDASMTSSWGSVQVVLRTISVNGILIYEMIDSDDHETVSVRPGR